MSNESFIWYLAGFFLTYTVSSVIIDAIWHSIKDNVKNEFYRYFLNGIVNAIITIFWINMLFYK